MHFLIFFLCVLASASPFDSLPSRSAGKQLVNSGVNSRHTSVSSKIFFRNLLDFDLKKNMETLTVKAAGCTPFKIRYYHHNKPKNIDKRSSGVKIFTGYLGFRISRASIIRARELMLQYYRSGHKDPFAFDPVTEFVIWDFPLNLTPSKVKAALKALVNHISEESKCEVEL
jgi:hypothetical protein